MTDETADIPNKQQLVLCLRWVDDNLTPNEKFIGMYPLVNTSANHIVLVIKAILLRVNFQIEQVRDSVRRSFCNG